MILFSYVLSASVFFVSFWAALYFSRGKVYIPLISWFLVASGTIYGLATISVFEYVNSGGEFSNSEILLHNKSIWWLHGLLSLILVGSTVFGWLIPLKNKKVYSKLVNKTFSLNNKEIFKLAVFLFVLSVILRFFYVQAYGGFMGYLEFNRSIRSGIFTINNPYSFLQPFGNLALISCYFFASLLYNRYKLLLTSILFVLSLCFSLYVQYSYSGRVGFIIFIGVIALSFLYYKKINTIFILLLVFAFVPLSMVIIYVISNKLGLKGADSIGFFIVKETSHLYRSFFAQLNDGFLYRGFIDFILAPLHLLPSSWLPSSYNEISQTNTALILGAKKGEGGVTGGIPVDLLTLGLMQLHIFGIAIVGFLFGWLLRRFDFFISLIELDHFRYVIISYFSLRIAFMGTLYAHPAHFMSGLFVFVFIFIVLNFMSFIKKIKL